MQASSLPCLTSRLSGWTVLELEEVSPENESSLLGPSSRQGPAPGDSPKQIPEETKSALPKPGAMILLFALFLSLNLLSSTVAWSLQPRLPPACAPPTKFFFIRKYEVQQCPPPAPLSE